MYHSIHIENNLQLHESRDKIFRIRVLLNVPVTYRRGYSDVDPGVPFFPLRERRATDCIDNSSTPLDAIE